MSPAITEIILGGDVIEIGGRAANSADFSKHCLVFGIVEVAIAKKIYHRFGDENFFEVTTEELGFVSSEDGFACGSGEFGLEVSADHADLVSGIDLDGHIEETAADLFDMAIEFERNVGGRIAGDDWKTTEESEMPIGIGGLEIFKGEVAEARGLEARFKVFEAFGRSHFADSQNIGLNLFDDRDDGGDG